MVIKDSNQQSPETFSPNHQEPVTLTRNSTRPNPESFSANKPNSLRQIKNPNDPDAGIIPPNKQKYISGIRYMTHMILEGFAVLVMMFALLSSSLSHARCDDFAFITTTDYETGSSSVIYMDGSHTNDNNVASIHSDAVSRYYQGLVYVVNRYGADNIQVLDPSTGFSTTLQFSVGNGSNPKDIAFYSPTKAYVTRYETNSLWIVNPSTGDHLDSIDLSSYADSDGLCEMDQMLMLEQTLYVTIQRLDRDNWLPVGDSYVAVIDATADTLIDVDNSTPGTQSIALPGTNPVSNIQYNRFKDNIFVSCVGQWAVNDYGVVEIDPQTYQSTCCMLDESEAGGDINDVEIFSPTKGYAIITNSSFNTELISFNPATGEKLATIYNPGDYVINDIETSPEEELYLADQTETNPGIRIYDIETDTEIPCSPIDVGLPPFDICFTTQYYTSANIPPVVALGQNYPNPFNPSTTIPFSLGERKHITINIYDVSGKLVKTLADGVISSGGNRVEWHGKDNHNQPVSSGVYFASMNAGEESSTIKMILIR
jgi:hypothetical protein